LWYPTISLYIICFQALTQLIHTIMDITQSIKRFFLSVTAFSIMVWGRVWHILPSHPSNTLRKKKLSRSPAFDLESKSQGTRPYPQAPLTITQRSQNPENQPKHFHNIAQKWCNHHFKHYNRHTHQLLLLPLTLNPS
jgi:hypothetical protein